MIIEEAQYLLHRFGIYFGKAESVPVINGVVKVPLAFEVPSALIEQPYVPSLLAWEHGDFVTRRLKFTLDFDDELPPAKIEKKENAFGCVIATQASQHMHKRIVSFVVEDETPSPDVHVLFITRNYMAANALRELKYETRCVRYYDEHRDVVQTAGPLATVNDDDVEIMECGKTLKPLMDGITLSHFADQKRVVMYLCCGTLFSMDFLLESHAVHNLRMMTYPFLCPECKTLAFKPTGNIRRIPKRILDRAKGMTHYSVDVNGIQFE